MQSGEGLGHCAQPQLLRLGEEHRAGQPGVQEEAGVDGVHCLGDGAGPQDLRQRLGLRLRRHVTHASPVLPSTTTRSLPLPGATTSGRPERGRLEHGARQLLDDGGLRADVGRRVGAPQRVGIGTPGQLARSAAARRHASPIGPLPRPHQVKVHAPIDQRAHRARQHRHVLNASRRPTPSRPDAQREIQRRRQPGRSRRSGAKSSRSIPRRRRPTRSGPSRPVSRVRSSAREASTNAQRGRRRRASAACAPRRRRPHHTDEEPRHEAGPRRPRDGRGGERARLVRRRGLHRLVEQITVPARHPGRRCGPPQRSRRWCE